VGVEITGVSGGVDGAASAGAGSAFGAGGASGAHIAAVDEDSPAQRAGLTPGMVIQAVDGQPLRDSIDWLWLTDSAEIQLTLADAQTLNIIRDFGEPWGISFVDPLFNGIMTCCNACLFCFMSMLPKDMRSSLYLRDDDYRLSFLQGNFVTLTNLGEEDVERIIEQHISPLHVSLHATTPEIRRQLMGKNHARGLEVLEELLGAGIEFHAQIVLVPGINDGKELEATLRWIEERPNILSVGIVPYGYTKYAKLQRAFSQNEAKALISQLAPYQERARATTGTTRFQAADEWYLRAGVSLPEAGFYDDFPQYEDGIGMLRAFIDDWQALSEQEGTAGMDFRFRGNDRGACGNDRGGTEANNTILITGEAFALTLTELTNSLPVTVVAIKNNFFGGNVDVAGLLTAADIIEQLRELKLPTDAMLMVPDVIFNVDGLTLDNKTLNDIAESLQRQVIMVPCSAIEFYETLSTYCK
jgi:putative radical SAM enzyme (TIGR03279 family)